MNNFVFPTLACASGFTKKSTLSHVLNGEKWVTRRSGLRLRLLLRISSQWCRWFWKYNSCSFGTVYFLNQDNPVPNCPNSYACLTACKNTKHTVSRWYSTVYIPWLVASYDTHNGKRWLNSNPPIHRGHHMYEKISVWKWESDMYYCLKI